MDGKLRVTKGTYQERFKLRNLGVDEYLFITEPIEDTVLTINVLTTNNNLEMGHLIPNVTDLILNIMLTIFLI